MKRTAVLSLTLTFASAVFAGLSPGFVVNSGRPFPIIADLNGDGLDDLIQETTYILNDGGTLTELRQFGFSGERVIGVLDANGDRRLDLLTEGTSVLFPAHLPQPPIAGPGYRMYLATASGSYSAPIAISSGSRPYIADIDADGRDDFIVMSDIAINAIATEANMTVLRSRGDGTFESLASLRVPASPQIMPDYRMLSGDLNHDGLTDLVMRCPRDLVVLLGTGGGEFTVQSRYLPMNDNFGARSLRLADIDGDSNLDIVLPAQRAIRVFFGDGRGNFPRVTRAAIAKLHEIEMPPGLERLVPANISEPRSIALGHFTRSDRMQIAAGTVEGDIVVFSYDQHSLEEVSRTRTEFWHLDVRSGQFGAGGDDVWAMGTLIWGDNWPRPRLFNGSDAPTAAGEFTRASSRRRAARSGGSDLALQMEIRADCIDEASAQWRFSRDGVFGLAKRGATTIEAVFDGSQIFFRLSASYTREPVYGVLTEEDGSYSGSAQVMTSCGSKMMTVSAKME